MTLPLLNILPKILKTVGNILSIDILKNAGTALETASIPPEKQVELQQALLEHEKALEQLDVERLKSVVSEAIAMIQSPDKFVSRARPTGLYIAYTCTVALTIALITHVKIDPTAILTLMGPLYGAQGYYMHLRTKEKLNGNSGD